MSEHDRVGLGDGRVPVVVVDLDSTLCDTRGRRFAAPTGEAKSDLEAWKPYSKLCLGDVPIKGAVELVRLLHGPCLVFLLSARNDCAVAETRAWLAMKGVPWDRMRLRADDELEPTPSAWKANVVRTWQAEGWDVRLFIDDWRETCQEITAETGVRAVCPSALYDGYTPGH